MTTHQWKPGDRAKRKGDGRLVTVRAVAMPHLWFDEIPYCHHNFRFKPVIRVKAPSRRVEDRDQ